MFFCRKQEMYISCSTVDALVDAFYKDKPNFIIITHSYSIEEATLLINSISEYNDYLAVLSIHMPGIKLSSVIKLVLVSKNLQSVFFPSKSWDLFHDVVFGVQKYLHIVYNLCAVKTLHYFNKCPLSKLPIELIKMVTTFTFPSGYFSVVSCLHLVNICESWDRLALLLNEDE